MRKSREKWKKFCENKKNETRKDSTDDVVEDCACPVLHSIKKRRWPKLNDVEKAKKAKDDEEAEWVTMVWVREEPGRPHT